MYSLFHFPSLVKTKEWHIPLIYIKFISRPHKGETLLEILVALFLLGLTLQGLMNYQSVLLQQIYQIREHQQAWVYAQQAIENYLFNTTQLLEQGWQQNIIITPNSANCFLIESHITSPKKYQAVLQQWQCS